MKLTDEKVAKALGWHHEFWTNSGHRQWYTPISTSKRWQCPPLPKWTTSLDAIVAEIEARGLYYDLRRTGKPLYRAQLHSGEPSGKWTACRNAEHPAEALALSLLAYLKDSHDPA